jgi:hypothetical protein
MQLSKMKKMKKKKKKNVSIYPVLIQKDKDLKENMPGGEFVKWTF